jgi:hypothetical protein
MKNVTSSTTTVGSVAFRAWKSWDCDTAAHTPGYRSSTVLSKVFSSWPAMDSSSVKLGGMRCITTGCAKRRPTGSRPAAAVHTLGRSSHTCFFVGDDHGEQVAYRNGYEMYVFERRSRTRKPWWAAKLQQMHKIKRPDHSDSRCQRINVLGCTTAKACRQSNQRESQTMAIRVAVVARRGLTLRS